jgi:hypothetical protein
LFVKYKKIKENNMTNKKDKKKKDINFTDETGGGGEGEVLTKDDFLRVLDRAIRPQKQESDEEK